MEVATLQGVQMITCPTCGSDALYRYGHTRGEKQRYLCLMCGRQFTLHTERQEVKHKPSCPVCGRPMNLYKRETRVLRFRCSTYPDCRTYRMVQIGGEE